MYVHKHLRKTSKGKTVVRAHVKSGKAKKHVKKVMTPMPEITHKEQKVVYDNTIKDIIADLKKEKRAKIPQIGILTVKTKPAQKGGVKKFNPITKENYISKAKPASKKIKFRPSKDLLEVVNK